MDFLRCLHQITTQNAALRDAARRAGPDVAVPSCPEWTVRELLSHQIGVHRWARIALDSTSAPRFRAEENSDFTQLLDRSAECAELLVHALTERGPNRACWTFGEHGTTAFWARRQAHETSIHRLDAELAVSGSTMFAADFADDGIDELLTTVVPALAKRRERPHTDATILIDATDTGSHWAARLRVGQSVRADRVQDPIARPHARIAGSADEVYRAVWGRPSRAVITGDSTLLVHLACP